MCSSVKDEVRRTGYTTAVCVLLLALLLAEDGTPPLLGDAAWLVMAIVAV
jgi:hypothetical protein